MIGFFIALISGALMSIQGVFNTQVTKATSIWVSSSFVQLTALITSLLMWFCTGRKSFAKLLEVENKYTLLGGIIGAFITYTVIRSVSELGTAKAILLIVITQIVVAYVIELFGLFGSEKGAFSWIKVAGLAVSVIGILIFNYDKLFAK